MNGMLTNEVFLPLNYNLLLSLAKRSMILLCQITGGL